MKQMVSLVTGQSNGEDKFRQLQRKANPLGKSLFSIIIAQHEHLLDWLSSLPFVDPKRLGFYGLSYGGKTAMRVPAVLDRYALSICSADFNEWVWKTTSVDSPYSYMFTREYDMLEFDFGNIVNYSDLANLMARVATPCLLTPPRKSREVSKGTTAAKSRPIWSRLPKSLPSTIS